MGGYGTRAVPDHRAFSYEETVVLARLPGKPTLYYTQRTRSPEGRPLHSESGFYRFGEHGVEMVIAQPTGIAETYHGAVTAGRVEFDLIAIALTPSAVEVQEIRRILEVDGDTMSYRLDMAAVGQPLLLHLEARLQRAGPG